MSKVTLDVSTDNLYWNSRLLAVMADANYASCVQQIERYELAVMTKARKIIKEYDQKIAESSDASLAEKANDEICSMVKEQTSVAMNRIILEASKHMKNGYNLADH